MIVDLHSHYPMHVLAGDPGIRPELESPLPAALLARLQRVILRIANEAANYPHDGREPAVTGRRLFDSPIRIALSVLYVPFDEMDLDTIYGSPPEGHYFGDLRDLLLEVKHHVATHDRDFVEIAPDLDRARAIAGSNRTALIHAVEGGFHLGDSAAAIETNVAELARLGVAYITVAHLFWRQIATNVPAIPFLPDETYEQIFPQPASGLAPLGRALITAMHRHGILVDLCHMSRAAIADTFALLDTLDPGGTTPVIATHGACRAIHDVEHNLHDEDIARIMSRAGVIGLIASSHWMAPDGRSTKDFEETMEVLWSHIEHIEAVATRNGHRAGHHYCAIGSDQDGFIKPPLKGLEFPAGYTSIEDGLMQRYGAEAAARICSGNALRVLEAWGGMTR